MCELEKEEFALRQRMASSQEKDHAKQLANLESEIGFVRGKILYRDERLAFATLTLHLSTTQILRHPIKEGKMGTRKSSFYARNGIFLL